MSVLCLDAAILAAINGAVVRARAKPIAWERIKEGARADDSNTMRLADRPTDWERPPVSELVSVPIDFRCSISFEYQPAGLFRHLSVSLGRGQLLPPIPSFEAIATAFGFSDPTMVVGRTWLEEFQPGCWAVNRIELCREDA